MSKIGQKPLRFLFLCFYGDRSTAHLVNYIRGISRFSQHNIYVVSNLGRLPESIDIERFDGVLIHYSLVLAKDNFVSPETRERLRAYTGFKGVFIQDEYRFINRTVEMLRYIGAHALFSVLPEPALSQIYPAERLPGVRKVTLLTGYVNEELCERPVPPFRERPIDVGYRARKLTAQYGRAAQEKWLIGERFLADAPRFGLCCDIAAGEENRILGEAWYEFIMNCKAVLGTESRVSVADFTGRIQADVERHLRSDPDAPFDLLHRLYVAPAEGNVQIAVVSPRCFEAAALRTLMILYEGEYSGIFKPWRHYVPLRRDHANMDEVVSVLRDPVRAGEILDAAYREVALAPEYGHRALAEAVDRVIDEEFRPQMRAPKTPYTSVEFASAVHGSARRPTRRWPESSEAEPQSAAAGEPTPLFRCARFLYRSALRLLPQAQREAIRSRVRLAYRVLESARTNPLIHKFVRRRLLKPSVLMGFVSLLPYALRRGPHAVWELATDEVLLRFLKYFCEENGIHPHLWWDPKSRILVIMEGSLEQHDEEAHVIEREVLREMLRAGEVKKIAWIAQSYKPMPPYLSANYSFLALAHAGRRSPDRVLGLILGGRGEAAWLSHCSPARASSAEATAARGGARETVGDRRSRKSST